MNRLRKRLNRFVLLIIAISVYFARGKANKVSPKFSKIIFVLTGKLGDIVCCTPVLLAVRAKLPHVRIIVAGEIGLQRAVLADSGLVDEYLDLENKGAIERIKKAGADAAIITGPSFILTALSYIAGVPLVVAPRVVGGFSPSETRPYKIIKKFIETFPYQIGKYAPRERLRGLEPLGIFFDDTKKHLGFSDAAAEKVKAFFSKNNINLSRDFVVAISPTAGNKIKEWPEERFAEVADYLATKYEATVIVVGGPKDVRRVERTINHTKSGKRFIVLTDFNINELKAFVSKLHLFVSVDTGPIYIAEAFGVPTIDITGPIDENEQPPIGRRNRIVVPPSPRKPELFVLNSKSFNYEEAKRQINSIQSSLVKETIDSLMVDLMNENDLKK